MEKDFDYVDFVYLRTVGGGGKARNEGLKKAKGDYVIFADADDYFNYCIYQILEEYANTFYDLVFFNANSVDTNTYLGATRCCNLNRLIADYGKNPSKAIFNLKYLFGEPWCKMIKHEIIVNNDIRFSETKIHNDTKFSYLVGHYSSNIFVDDRALYCVTERKNSVSRNPSTEALLTRTEVFSEATMFYRRNGIKMFGLFTFNALFKFLIRGDVANSKRCIKIMKSKGMSNGLITYGFILYAARKNWHILRKIVKA